MRKRRRSVTIQTALSSFIKVLRFIPSGLCDVVTVVETEPGKRQLLQLCPTFNPGMSYQIFEEEKIVGVKNPHIDIYFNPSTCDVVFSDRHYSLDVCHNEV